MARIKKECIDEAFDALKNFTRHELQDYVHDVFMRAKEIDDLQGGRAIEQAIKEINDEKLKSYFSDLTTKANNIMKYNKNAKLLKDKKLDMDALLIARGKKLSENVSLAQKAEFETIWNQVMGDLSHEEVEHLASGKYSTLICDIFDGKKSDDAFSTKIAKKFEDYFVYRNAQLVLSGAMHFDEINEDRFFRAVHNQERIINGTKSLPKIAMERVTKKFDLSSHKEFWKNGIKRFLNLEKTFRYTDATDLTGNLDMAKSDRILDVNFNNITTGKSQIFTRSVVANDREAVANKSRMFFYWKSLRDLYEYNKIFGKGDLFEMFLADAHATANKIGMAKMWGDNPYSMYNDLRKVQQEVEPKSERWWKRNERFFKMVNNEDQGSISPTTTNFLANLRTVSSMARLPLIALDSISDIGYIAAFGQRMGINYSKVYLNALTHIFDTFPNEKRMRIAKLFYTQVNSELGFMGRFVENNNASDFLQKISTRFFKFFKLTAFDRGNKVGIMTMMGEHLNDISSERFSNLDKSTQQLINKFLTKEEWNLLKKKNQNGLFSTENVDALTDDEIKSHYEKSSKEIPLNEVRGDLYRKVYSMFTVASENAVLSPSEFEKVFVYRGTQSGEGWGEISRIVGHFKMYSLAYIDRVLLHGYKDADTASQKLMWATSMLVGTIPLSVMSIYFHNLLQGQTMPVWDEMNIPERNKYLLSILAPSLALFSGMLDPKNQNSSMVFSLLGSPSTNLIGNAMSVPLALMDANPKLAAKNLAKAANYIFPIQTLPVISPLVRQAMGDEAHMEPGQTHIFGQ